MSTEASPGSRIDEPALFLTAQTTLPVVAALGAAIAIALIPLSEITRYVERIAVVIAVLALLAFVVSVQSCVKVHGWDIGSLGPNRREELASLSSEAILRCIERRGMWYFLAAHTFNIGWLLVLASIALIFYHRELVVTYIATGFVLLEVALVIVNSFCKESVDRLLSKLASKVCE